MKATFDVVPNQALDERGAYVWHVWVDHAVRIELWSNASVQPAQREATLTKQSARTHSRPTRHNGAKLGFSRLPYIATDARAAISQVAKLVN